ncbi:MAG: protein phosphatase 2C domain-containing protein [Endomicrobium sp.]|jgi:protein phosphatase|nr:protein phosphatase 2C domain-containing protein [Endomicrobium sp.]
MKVSYYAKTDIGLVRTENQDCYGIGDDFYLVCDGMGGGVAGAFASQIAVDIILKLSKTINNEQVRDIIEDFSTINNAIDIAIPIATIMLANRMLYNLIVKYPKLASMGTTVVLAKVDKEYNVINVYHVGDSRLYRVREGHIELLTKDHSKINDLLDSRKITKEDIKFTENQNVITRALGMASNIKVDYRQYDYKIGDFYIMCSDGLNGEIGDEEINNLVNKNSTNLAFAVNELIAAANRAGGRDNTTVIIFTIDDDGQPVKLLKDIKEEVLSFSDDDLQKNLYEDRILKKVLRKLGIKVRVPENFVKEKKFTKHIAISLVASLVLLTFFVYYFFSKKSENKTYDEQSDNISGVVLNIRRLKENRLKAVQETNNYYDRKQLLEEAKTYYENYSFIFVNAVVFIEEKNGYNKFIAFSGSYPIKVYLPIGKYKMYLKYKGFSMINDNFEIVKQLDFSVDLVGGLKEKIILMVPNTLGD